MRRHRWPLPLAFVAASACVVEYDPSLPAGLDDVPTISGDDVLVYERDLIWWEFPSAQAARLYLRDDGSYLMLRSDWRHREVYGWATAGSTPEGASALETALANADPGSTGPAPGEFSCTYRESAVATIHLDDEMFAYPSLCPPNGLQELAGYYADAVELMLDCPADGSWFEGDPPVSGTDCAIAD